VIDEFKRPADVASYGVIHDLLWADPNPAVPYFSTSKRSFTYTFGKEAAIKFMKSFGFEMILRAHETVPEGFVFPFGREVNLVTLFTATDYQDHNKGAVMLIDENLQCAVDTLSVLPRNSLDTFDRTNFNDHM
jgi:serine/threonine-protein phosphatase PP1 catalytic subunit